MKMLGMIGIGLGVGLMVGGLIMLLFGGCSRLHAGEVIASTSPAGDYCAFPGVCRLPDGRLCVVFYAGTGHVTWNKDRERAGAIAYTLSENEGKTWSEPDILLDTELDDRDPNISVLRDGRIMLAYFQLIADDKKGGLKGDGVYIAEVTIGEKSCQTTKAQKSVAMSADIESAEATTTTDSTTKGPRKLVCGTPVKVQHDAGGGGPLRDFGDGHLLLGTYHLGQPYIVRSTDNGKTWQVHDIPNGGKHLDAETDVIELTGSGGGRQESYAGGEGHRSGHGLDGLLSSSQTELGRIRPARTFYAVMRGRNCNGHYSTSTDGKNWTVAKDIGFVLHCPELHRVRLGGVDTNTRVFSHQGVRASLVHPTAILLAHRVPATAMHYSLDECKTWQGPVVVDSCGGAYPGFVTLKDGSVLIVYYTEGKDSNILGRVFRVTEKGVVWQ